MEDFAHWNLDEELEEWELLNSHSQLSVPGASTCESTEGLDQSSNVKKFSINDYRGKFLVLVFFKADFGKKAFLQPFSDLSDSFRGSKTEVVACSSLNISELTDWKNASDGSGWNGNCQIALWSDPEGLFASKFDMWDHEGFCRNGVVVIDDAGVVRHSMTTSMEASDTAKYTMEMAATLRKNKVNANEISRAKTTSSTRALSPVNIDREELEKDWDVSQDPELLKVLSKAKMLGQAKPAKIQVLAKTPIFNLNPDDIRKLNNPKRGNPVRWCSASLHRNLSGFGNSGDISQEQKIKLENLVKKVMGVAYMPEDLTGKYISLATLSPRDQAKFFESDLFLMSEDSWMKQPGAVEWSKGKGVFINNYSNFILWVGLDDQLRFTSVGKGTDLKYVLLRLQKAMARIEEALKMVFSTKSCNERGFATSKGGFCHSKRGVYRTGFNTTFTMDLPGFNKAEKLELDKAKNDLFLDIEKERTGSLYTVTMRQSPDDSEEDIVTRSVEAVDALWIKEQELQAKLGVKLNQAGRSL